MNGQTQANEARTGVIGGAILVAIGALFLAQELFSLDFGRYGWPFFIIGPGLLLFGGMVVGGRGAGDFAIPASIVTTVGLILFTQNLTGHFESWSYAWTLIMISVGIGQQIAGRWNGNAKQVREGREVALLGLVFFLGFGTFFELIIFRSIALAPYVLPAVLIIGGAALVVRNALQARRVVTTDQEALDDSTPGGWSL
jgi:hypothetical protein